MKTAVGYFSGMGAYGFYRGYNGLYKKDFKKQDELVTNRIISGFGGMFFQSNPLMQFYNLYGIALRTEKSLKGIPLNANDYEY